MREGVSQVGHNVVAKIKIKVWPQGLTPGHPNVQGQKVYTKIPINYLLHIYLFFWQMHSFSITLRDLTVTTQVESMLMFKFDNYTSSLPSRHARYVPLQEL